MARDVLHAIESVYRTDYHDDKSWLEGLLEGLGHLDTGVGIMGALVDGSGPGAIKYSEPVGRGLTAAQLANWHANVAELSPEAQRRLFMPRPELVATLSEIIGAELERSPTFREHYASAGMHDGLVIFAIDANARGCAVSIGQRSVGPTPRPVRAALARVAIHAVTGLRLRRALAVHAAAAPDGEAVLTPDGRVEHAVGDAKDTVALEALRNAAVGIERARSTRKKDPAAATDLWKALASGRWSLVDRFDRDGRRFMIAMRNDSAGAAITELSSREAQVAALVGLGRSSKLIAYELGLGQPVVSRALASAMRKLGVRSRAALAARVAAANQAAAVR